VRAACFLSSLQVTGDPSKVQQIARYLILLAMSTTARGCVHVSCTEGETIDREQWILSVTDAGRSFDPVMAPGIVQSLKRATEEAHAPRASGSLGNPLKPAKPVLRLVGKNSQTAPSHSERDRIRLSIVKQLCELLNASLELEVTQDEGMTFRVIFPKTYSSE
jgi:hypothetical protein